MTCMANVASYKQVCALLNLLQIRCLSKPVLDFVEFLMHCEMDAKDGENQATKDTHKERVEEKHTFDAFITSPQQTPRFTDSYAASLYQTPEGSTEYPSPSPIKNPKDDSSSDPSDNQGDESLSGEDDTEDDRKPNRYRNPEPPMELLEQHIVDADNIGNTVYSKRWVFATLMNLLKVSWQVYIRRFFVLVLYRSPVVLW